MSNSHQKLASKQTQYTRKKIENYSYGLNDVIGKGYSSQVYKGRNDNTDVPVAVKVIDLKMLKNQINRVLLQSEIEILKQLKNRQNILTLHDVYTTKNNTYLITQLCSSDMNKVIKNKLTEPQACFYMNQLIQGYQQIHLNQIVHRDLKPANLLLTQNKILKIADFGFGIKMKQLLKPSKYNVGSPLYMAPQSLRKNQYSFKTDLWSIGVIFYQMLTGDTPWRAKTEKQLLKKIQSQTISKVLERKRFSKVSEQFLSRILLIDKNQRLGPEQLSRYNFKSIFQGSLVPQKILSNMSQRNTRFQSVNSVSSSNNFISPKHAFNQSIEKNFFQKQKSQKNMMNNSQRNILTVTNTCNLLLKNKKQVQTMKQINQNVNPLVKIQIQNKNISNPQQSKSEDKKSISKVLISIVHFCRFLYKLINRMKQSQTCGILKQIGYFQVQSVYYSYTQTIKHMISLLKSFPKKDFLRLKTYQNYKQTSDFTKLMKISEEYFQRYYSQLKSFWSTEENQENQPKFSSFQTAKLINTMLNYIQDIVNGMDDPQTQVSKLSKDIIIIDYLMTSKQLLQMFENGVEDYFSFAKKSRIQEIVEGTTSQISYTLYKKIVQKAKTYTVSPISPLNKAVKKFTTVFKDCSNRFNQTSPDGFRLPNPFLQNYNRQY